MADLLKVKDLRKMYWKLKRDLKMKKNFWALTMLATYLLDQSVAFAQNIKVENSTLQKTLDAMAPVLKDYALSATFYNTPRN